MKFRGVELPRWWWFPFLGIVGMLVMGIASIVVVWTGGLVSDAEKARLVVERSATPRLDDLDEAIRLNPDFLEGYVKRARARAASGDFNGALSDVDRALEASPASESLLQLRAEIRQRRAAAISPAQGDNPSSTLPR